MNARISGDHPNNYHLQYTEFKSCFKDKDKDLDYTKLIYKPCDDNFLKFLPKEFILTTKNNSCKFNTSILSNISNIILKSLEENPRNLQYHLDIEDKSNILGKFEKLFYGEMIYFNDDEIITFNEITNKLNIINEQKVSKIKFSYIHSSAHIDMVSLRTFLKNDIRQTFTIQTKNNEYKCNYYGIYLSTVIGEIKTKNPNLNHFTYDYEDENGEFEIIQKIFNLQDSIIITKDKIDILLEIAEDLKIESLIKFINDNKKSNEKISKYVERQQETINLIDDLFDLLYHIREKSIDSIVKIIISSNWSKTKENIYELAASLFQVIQTNASLHKYIVDLLIELNKNKINELEMLLPYMIQKSLFLFNENKEIENSNSLIFSFVYQLLKKGLIQKDKISFQMKKINWFVVSWFLPEFLEANPDIISINIKKKIVVYRENFEGELDNFNRIEECIKMDDNNFVDDQIKISLQNDDIDTFQLIVSKNLEQLLKEEIEPNLYENFIIGKIRFLNYAAAYGSIKCFKYMLLNNEKIDGSTFEMAIIGGNNEIIRIVYNDIKNNEYSILKGLYQSIKRHQNEYFDWILDNKFDIIKQNTNLISLISCSLKNGNIKSFIRLVDCCFNFTHFTNKYYQYVEYASEGGFNFLFNLLINTIDNIDDIFIFRFNLDKFVKGNVKMFQLMDKIMTEYDYSQTIILAIQFKCFEILEYIIVKMHENNFKFNILNSTNIFVDYLNNNFGDSFKDLLIEICTFNVVSFCNIIEKTYKSYNIDVYKKIADFIYRVNSNNDFTGVSIVALKLNLNEILVYFIDQKYSINYEELAETIIKNKTNDEMFSIIISNLDSETKNRMIDYYEIVNKENNFESTLINAVKENDFSMVESILKNNIEPFLINKNSKYGTALTISVQNSNSKILKTLLSISNIDPNIYNMNFETPLILSISQTNEEIFNIIFNFYGDKIKKQKWQLEKIVKHIISADTIDNESTIKILTRIIDLNCINPNLRVSNNTILTYACKNNLINIVKNLLQYEIIDVNLNISTTGDTPLIISILSYNNEITRILIKHPKTDFNLLNNKRKSAFFYAAKLNQDDIVELLLTNEKSNLSNKTYFYSNLNKFKQYLLSTYSKFNIYNQKMLRESIPIKIEPKNDKFYDFTVSFSNISTRNLNEPIISPEFFTGGICTKYIIDFNEKSFLIDKTDFLRGGFIKIKITFLNQESQLNKTIIFSFLYPNNHRKESKILPISNEDFLNPQKGWLVDDTIKIKIEFVASLSLKSYLYPVQTNYSLNCGGFKFLIPTSLFNQDKLNKTIDFPIVNCKTLIIKPSIIFFHDGNKLKIQTNFKINCPNNGDEPLIDFIFYYENIIENKNFYTIFTNVETNYVQMPVFSPEESLEKDGFVFSYESKKVIHLCLKIHFIPSFTAKFPFKLEHKKTIEDNDLFLYM